MGRTWAWGPSFGGHITGKRYLTEGTFSFWDDRVKIKNGFGAERTANIRCDVSLDSKTVLLVYER